MKKLLFITAATLALSSAAMAQTANNCTMVHQVMTDLQKDIQMMTYRGEEILSGSYESKVKFTGFVHTSVMVDDFSTYLISETAPTPQKADALKVYNAYVEQLKNCLKHKGFKPEDNSSDYVTETVFMDPNPTNLMASVGLAKLADQYIVTMTIRKNNQAPGLEIE